MNVLSCVGCFFYDDMGCGWDDWCFIVRVEFMSRSWDPYSYEFLMNCLSEFKVLECLAMLIELYVGSWVW